MAITKPDMEFIWASGGAIVEPSDAKKQTGWTAEVPPHQWENWIQNRQDKYLAHINERGIPEWDSNTDYLASGRSYVQGSDGKIYKSVAASGHATTIQDPTTDVSDTYWTVAFADVGAFLTQASGDARYAQLANNLSDLTNAATARTNLGIVDATESAKGLVELATVAETLSGASSSLAIHPAGVAATYAKKFMLIARDEKPSGTGGGNNATGFNVRTLNTVSTNTIAGASLASNRITLPAGTYRISASAPFSNGDQHRLKLYNVTDSSTAILGTSENAGGSFTTRSFVVGRITIASPKVFELQHYMPPTVYTDGLGFPVNDGSNEVYAEITVETE